MTKFILGLSPKKIVHSCNDRRYVPCCKKEKTLLNSRYLGPVVSLITGAERYVAAGKLIRYVFLVQT